MPEANALNEEEQKIFEQMEKADAQAAKAEEKPAAKAEEKPAPEGKTEGKAAPEKKESAMVPKGALDEARSHNKDLRKELEAMKSLVAEGDKKLQQFIDKVSKQAEQSPPKFEEDPAGNLKHENEQLKKALEEIRSKVENQEKAAQAGGEVAKFKATVDAKEDAFAKEHPDYWKAAEYVQSLWKDELIEAGFEEADIPKILVGKAMGITHKAIQAGRDPAATIYNIAKRAGFTTAKTEEKRPDAEAKLKTIAKGQELSKGTGGGTGPDELSIAALAQMDDESIDKLVQDKDWWSKNIKRSALH